MNHTVSCIGLLLMLALRNAVAAQDVPPTARTPAPAAAAAAAATAASGCPEMSPVVQDVTARMRKSQIEPGPPPDLSNLSAIPGAREYMAFLAEERMRDWAGLCRYRAANVAQRAAGSVRAVFIGSSIVEGWAQADPLLFGPDVIGRGISGQTSSQLLVRFMADVVALRPKMVHIMTGSNDIAGNTGPVLDEDYRNNVRAMVALAAAHDIAVVLASVPPSKRFPMRPDLKPASRILAFNAWLREFAAASGVVYADYHTVLRDAEDGLPTEVGNDGLHPNRLGFERMRPIALQAIEAALKRPRGSRAALP